MIAVTPICIECGKPILRPEHAAEGSILPTGDMSRWSRSAPRFAVHIQCDRERHPSVCAGHRTPPGLEEIERFIK